MTKENDPAFETAQTFANLFGRLSLTMLTDTELSPVWRISFVANFFTGPVYTELMERFGLSRPGFVILFSLSHQDGLVARDICGVTGLPKNSISRAVTELEAKELIARDTDRSDKRAKPLHLTEAGRSLLGEIVPIFTERQAAMRAPLSTDEAAEFDRLITKIVYGMPIWAKPD
ncbi:MAG: MarR family transcriptional regulator [Pseudomonadota bacterium]